ncbi:MAG: hypothetical protein ACYCUF_03195 [Acidimicrobiales bacterium]
MPMRRLPPASRISAQPSFPREESWLFGASWLFDLSEDCGEDDVVVVDTPLVLSERSGLLSLLW